MKIKKIYQHEITFDNGTRLTSEHKQDDCEQHYIDFTSIIGQEWEGRDFPENLGDLIFEKAADKGIYIENWESFITIRDYNWYNYILTIYNSNNGYYNTGVTLVLKKKGKIERIKIQSDSA